MRRYSIGHELFLVSTRNNLVTLTHESFSELPIKDQIAAVTLATDVCSQTWQENNTSYHRWIDKWRIQRQWNKWERANRNSDWALAIADFRAYRAEGSTFPPLTEDRFSDTPSESEGGRAFGSPFMARLVNYLRKSGIPEAEIMDFPLGQAAFEYFSAMEEEGRIQVENASENETRLSFEANVAAIRAEQEAERLKTQQEQA